MNTPTRAAAAAVLAMTLVLGACTGSGSPAPSAPDPGEPRTLQGQVLRDAQDVAGQLEQRQAELESMLP